MLWIIVMLLSEFGLNSWLNKQNVKNWALPRLPVKSLLNSRNTNSKKRPHNRFCGFALIPLNNTVLSKKNYRNYST